MKMKRILSLMLMFILCVVTFTACSSSTKETAGTEAKGTTGSEAKETTGAEETTDDKVEFTLAFTTWVGSGPFFIAQEKGFYEKYGIKPTIKIIDDESQFAAAIGSDAIQALGHVIDREVISYANGIEEKFVMAYDQSTGGDGIIASKEIKTVADLKGKKVALDKASTSYFFFLSVIEEAGLKESDLTIADMDADSAGTSFVQGEVDAAVTWEPWLSNASEREGGHLLVSSADYPNTIVDGVTFNQKFIDAHPEAITAFVKAWDDAVDWYYENKDEGNKIMADGLGISVEDVEAMIPGVTFYDRDSMKKFFDTSIDNNIYEVAERAGNFWYDLGVVNKKIDVNEMITDEYLE